MDAWKIFTQQLVPSAVFGCIWFDNLLTNPLSRVKDENKWRFHSVQMPFLHDGTKPSPFFIVSHLILTHQLSFTSWDIVNIQQPNEKSFSLFSFCVCCVSFFEICTHFFVFFLLLLLYNNMFCICEWLEKTPCVWRGSLIFGRYLTFRSNDRNLSTFRFHFERNFFRVWNITAWRKF